MSNVVSFVNPGVIDIRCITTQGASIKEGDNPIGYFGTGLKYAIAIILRNGGRIVIHRGMEGIHFNSKPTPIRGKDFNVVYMDGKELGFTTDLGKNWQMWQAFREIYCNALDEEGQMVIGKCVPPKEGQTTIWVISEQFAAEALRKREYVLDEDEPIYAHPKAAFFAHTSNNIYYRGVRVKDKTYKPYLFTPNIFVEQELTEDRTLKYDFSMESSIGEAIAECTDRNFLERWLLAGEDYAEYSLSINTWTIRDKKILLEVARTAYHDPFKYPKLNPSLKAFLQREEGEPHHHAAKLLPVEKLQLAESIKLCVDMGYQVDQYPIKVVETLGEGVLGMASKKLGQIYIARTAIAQGKLSLAGTLIEEWAHIRHEHQDCSRGFQNWLLQEMVKMGASYLMVAPCGKQEEGE